MANTDKIEYDPAKLREQCPIIQQSKRDALKNIGGDAYFRSIGLSANDPSELWKFALGRSEPFSDAEHYKQFRNMLGKPTLRETVLNLTNHIEDETVLTNQLAKLVKISERKPITKIDYELNRADSDKSKGILIKLWIQDDPNKWLLLCSLCFYSDRAMAKIVYWLANNREKWLPPELLTTEAERIRKVYGSLGLIPAHPRVFKDCKLLYTGKPHWEPFQNLVKK